MSESPIPPTVESTTYKLSQAAALAGVSVRTVRRWIVRGQVPGVFRVGKVIRLNRQRFDQWLERGGQASKEEQR